MAGYATTPHRQRWVRVLIVCLVAIVVVGIGSIILVRRAYENNLKPVSTSQTSQLVTIPLGSAPKEISQILKKANLIRSTWAFEWYIRNHNLREDLQAGTYNLHPNLSVQEIADEITQGKIATDLVTILPAQRIDQIHDTLINKYQFNPADVESALNPDNYLDHPALVDKPPGASLEGYLYPDSYEKTATTKASTVVRQSLDQMQKYLTPELRAGIVRQGLTVHQGVILASIVEQEAGRSEDRPIVAQVFLKRLRQSMALQSDATSGYGAILVDQEPSLTFDSLYNTYKHKGLPPGPISNVSVGSLQAVTTPAATDFLYFVADDEGEDKGKSFFSSTVEEHERLTKEHCKKLCNLP